MLVRFWGTRGSLPAPLDYRAVRAKMREALLAARGRSLDGAEAVDAFIDRTLPFSVAGTYGGNSSCVEIVAGGDEFVLCDIGTRRARVRQSRPGEEWACQEVSLQHLHVPSALGPRHGVPVLRAGLHSGQRHPHPRLPQGPCARRSSVSNRIHAFPSISASLARPSSSSSSSPAAPTKSTDFRCARWLQNHGGDSYGYRF